MPKPNLGTLSKADLAELIAQRTGVSKERGARALDDVVDRIAEHIAKGERVRIPGLAVIGATATPERPGRNPRTGEAITVPAGHRFSFTAAKALRERCAAA